MKNTYIFIVLSLFLYGVALSLPCLVFDVVPREGVTDVQAQASVQMRGIELIIAGLFGLILTQVSAIGWLANPAYLVSCFFLFRQEYQFSGVSALISVLLGFSGTLLGFWFRLPYGSSPFNALELSELLPGFWLWLAAPGLIGLVSTFKLVRP